MSNKLRRAVKLLLGRLTGGEVTTQCTCVGITELQPTDLFVLECSQPLSPKERRTIQAQLERLYSALRNGRGGVVILEYPIKARIFRMAADSPAEQMAGAILAASTGEEH